MSRPRAETIPAVTVPPRPNGLPTASTQSPMRGALSARWTEGEAPPPPALSRAMSGRRSVAVHLAVDGLAVVGRDLDGLGFVDDVVVGHRIAISSDEEAGALPGHEAIARGARFVGSGSFRQAEATEETLHLRVRRER